MSSYLFYSFKLCLFHFRVEANFHFDPVCIWVWHPWPKDSQQAHFYLDNTHLDMQQDQSREFDLWSLHVLNLFQSTRLLVSTVANSNLEVSFSRGHIAATRWISLFPLPWSICLLHPWHPQCSQSISCFFSYPFILSFPQSISFCLPPSFISPYLFISFFLSLRLLQVLSSCVC